MCARGLDNAGKSSIVAHWLNSYQPKQRQDEPKAQTDSIAPTFGFSIHSFPCPPYTICMWDIGGQRSLRPFWRTYYDARVDAVLWVIDASDGSRFAECFEEMRTACSDAVKDNTPLFVLANKIDLAEDVDVIRKCMSEGFKVFECSAYTGKGVNEALGSIVASLQAARGPIM